MRPPHCCVPLGKLHRLSGLSLKQGCGEGRRKMTFSRRWLRARELHTQRFKPPLHPLGVEEEPVPVAVLEL